MLGVVKWFNSEKAFGFIAPADGGKDLFVHVSALVDRYAEIKEGDRVEFERGEHRGRACAERVEIVD
jgi:CspA family cold shock protein